MTDEKTSSAVHRRLESALVRPRANTLVLADQSPSFQVENIGACLRFVESLGVNVDGLTAKGIHFTKTSRPLGARSRRMSDDITSDGLIGVAREVGRRGFDRLECYP